MKYFIATAYLSAGVILPVIYINAVETPNLFGREWLLLLTLFIFCGISGAHRLFSNKITRVEEQTASGPPPTPKKLIQRRTIQPSVQPKVVTAANSQEQTTAQKTRKTTGTTYPPSNKPELAPLMEDVKNFIKLESWLMALQKANEIIHFYPDSPEADKIRENINFLIQKVRGHNKYN